MTLAKLPIDLSKDYRLKIEKPEELTDSFFKGIYIQALKQVHNITEWTQKCTDDLGKSDFKRESQEYNNIIAFVGERGTGKSSAMITLANTLVKAEKSTFKNLGMEIKDEEQESYFHDFKFETLHTIDPTRFELGQNILEVIIAELFQKFQEKMVEDHLPKEDSDKHKRDVIRAFQDVYKSLQIVSKGNHIDKYDGDSLETLAKLAEGTNLEKNLQKLVHGYLKYLHPNNSESKSILIIPIDDFDLSVKHVSEMAEQVRKYLMVPQVLILMAVNIEQLNDVKTQDILNDFKTLTEYKQGGMSGMIESPRDIAFRYVLKLIPIERRIMIPNISIERNEVSLHLYVSNTKDTIISSKDNEKIESQLLKYIYDQTGLYFVNRPEEYHILIPNSLRELISFCTMFKSFTKVPINKNQNLTDTSKTISLKKKNLEIFEHYFLNTWTKDYLLPPLRKMILDSSSIAYKEWNKYFITSVVEILSVEEKYKEDWKDTNAGIFKDQVEIQNIVDRNNFASNVSLGDLIYFIAFIDRIYINDKEIKNLIFSLNCWYSIILNKLYYLNFDKKLDGKITDEKEKKEFYNNKYKSIKDIVNGTIVNKDSRILKKEDKSKIQFEIPNFKTLLNSIPKNSEDSKKFIENCIFIRNIRSEPINYRAIDKIIAKDTIDVPKSPNIENPVFNLFSFVCNNTENIFPIPYNNVELWQYIVEEVNKDIEQINYFDLIAELFNEIYEKIPTENMRENFINNKIISLFIVKENKKTKTKQSNVFSETINKLFKSTSRLEEKDLQAVLDYLKSAMETSPDILIRTLRSMVSDENLILTIKKYFKDNLESNKNLTDDILRDLEKFLRNNSN
jgi:hypothetical protein